MPTRHFLDWNRPLLASICDRLLPASGSGPLHLGHCLILAPTRQSGRRLRETLSREWRARGGTALLSLEVRSPSFLLQPAADLQVAHAFDVLAAWRDTLAGCSPDELPSLLPGRGEALTPSAALDFGRHLQGLREELLDAGLDLAQVAEQHPMLSEQKRWSEMARLETRYRAALAALGLQDPCDAKRAAAANFLPAPGIQLIVLAAVPDPSALVLRRLQELDALASPRIEVWIHAPASEADTFDTWGRPSPLWRERQVGPVTPDDTWIELLADPDDLQRRMIETFADAPPSPALAFGLLDDPFAPPVREALEQLGRLLYHPKPVGLEHAAPTRLLAALHTQRSEDSPSSLRALWRQPDLLAALSPRPERLLAAWDRFATDHLPVNAAVLDALLPESELRNAWQRIQHWLRADTPEAWLEVLRDVYAGRALDPANADERFALRAFSATADILQEAQRRQAAGRAPSLPVLLEVLRAESIDPPRVEGDVTAEGWLELSYHPAPSLLLIGLQEGVVPSTRVADPFLPDSLRAELNLRSDRDWLARDAFLFHSLACSRPDGALRVWVLKRDHDGNPLRPSRLLFACSDEALLRRAALLFHEPPPARQAPPPAPGLQLRADRAPARRLEKLSVSAVKDYLRCPTRFYLRHVLAMRNVDDLAREPDASHFGNILHAVLKSLALLQPPNEDAWNEAAESLLAAHLSLAYSPERSMALRVLENSARQRLHAVGPLHLAMRAEGWTTMYLETPCERDCGGLLLRGTIDRVDQHPTLGYRIIDYKSADTAQDPAKAHLGPACPEHPDWQVDVGGKTRRWTDLQLPLYRWLAQTLPGIDPARPMEVCYLQLPKNTRDTALRNWPEEAGLASAALATLEEVVRRIQAGVWTPAAERVTYDDFETLFHQGQTLCFD
jgi:ATP-dependent helicase/nuclease subunit B